MRISDWMSDVCSSDLPAGCIGLYIDRDGYQCEGIRCPVAHLMIGLITPDSRGQRHRRDEFARLQHIFDMGRRSGKRMEFGDRVLPRLRSEEHTSERQSLMSISSAVFCLKKKQHKHTTQYTHTI